MCWFSLFPTLVEPVRKSDSVSVGEGWDKGGTESSDRSQRLLESHGLSSPSINESCSVQIAVPPCSEKVRNSANSSRPSSVLLQSTHSSPSSLDTQDTFARAFEKKGGMFKSYDTFYNPSQ